MWTVLAFIGRLASPLLAVVPGFNPKAVLVLAGLFAGLVMVGGPAGAVWLHMRGEIKAAVVAERAEFKRMTAENKATTALAIAEILSTVDESSDHSENVVQYCKRNPGLCRKEGDE